MDKRHAKRLAGVSEVTLSRDGVELTRGSIDDLSDTGLAVMFLSPPLALSIGERVHVEFILPTGAVRATADVVRAERDALALQLVELEPDAGERLHTFLTSPLAGVE